MAIHPKFPLSAFEILDPEVRWFPGPESSRESLDKLIAPLVDDIRKRVSNWRESNYDGASKTSKALLTHWFKTSHPKQMADGTTALFQYYFAQREAMESIIYLLDVEKIKEPADLKKFDINNLLEVKDFEESWRRLVIKMATGAGKTKIMSLLIAWSFFHKNYEVDSDLSRNFLLIAPNIIVLERLREDFDGLKIFYEDPVIPENGFESRNWKSDFHLDLHIQDEVSIVNKFGNLFLTNIQRVYESKQKEPSLDDDNLKDYFLGKNPVGGTSKAGVDLDKVVREVEEIIVLNDEAHHIHDKKLTWFKCIQDIHNNLVQKGAYLSLQIDLTATPKKTNGAIFKQTISDYPLVEAIHQNVLKHPVLPDGPSREKLEERQSHLITEQFKDHIHLGYIEWEKSYREHQKVNKKGVLFVMTDDTKNCDEVGQYLESSYPLLKDSVLVIHTNNNGEINENVKGKKKEELNKLRREAKDIDSLTSPHKAVVSVLMLKEGWDVRNVTTIVGLRPFGVPSKILPEQALGRGLRKMYAGDVEEKVSVIGTSAFMEFVEGIKFEGVELEEKTMGEGSTANTPLVIEIDEENKDKDLIALDIKLPIVSKRHYREYKDLNDLDVSRVDFQAIEYKQYSEEQRKEIVFTNLTTEEVDHTVVIDSVGTIDYRNVVAYFSRKICLELLMPASYDILYEKVTLFIENNMFNQKVELENLNTLRNLSEVSASTLLIRVFTKAINDLTVKDRGSAYIEKFKSLRDTPADIVTYQDFILPHKSLFNKIIGDNNFERNFALFLDNCSDISSFAKNTSKVGFSVDYVDSVGKIRSYFPDFFVKISDIEYCIVETKGRIDIDDEHKLNRLKVWCEDVNNSQDQIEWDFVFVEQKVFESNLFKKFEDIKNTFTKYK